MTRSVCDNLQDASLLSEPDYSLRRLIRSLFSGRRRRKRFNINDLPPELLNDIGLETPPRHSSSLDEKWRLEMELQSK